MVIRILAYTALAILLCYYTWKSFYNDLPNAPIMPQVIPDITIEQRIDSLYPIIEQIESRGDTEAVGDNGRAWGPIQIHRTCVLDVNRVWNTSFIHSDAFEPHKAREIFRLYLLHGSELFCKRYGYYPSEEILARMWNGGIYKGYQRASTLVYLEKFRKEQKRQVQICMINN